MMKMLQVGEFVFRQPIVIDPSVSLLDCLNIFQVRSQILRVVRSHTVFQKQ